MKNKTKPTFCQQGSYVFTICSICLRPTDDFDLILYPLLCFCNAASITIQSICIQFLKGNDLSIFCVRIVAALAEG